MQVVPVPVSEAIISTAAQMFVLVGGWCSFPRWFCTLVVVFLMLQTGIGQPQTLWETTWTLQYKPAPSLMTRFEYRYDHSNKAVFLDNDTPKTSQQTLAFSVVYLF